MTTSADERWLAAARARASSGEWERDADAIFAELKRQRAEHPVETAATAGRCPVCADHPALQRFPRYELVSADPIDYCTNCYGFWAIGDALTRGVSDPGFDHPALRAVPAPRRCKECMGHLKPDNVCAKCGKSPAALNCPSCSNPMQRFKERGLFLDQCGPCRGTWFDTGEIAEVYDLEDPQSLAMATVDENQLDEAPADWLTAVFILARTFLPFLRF